MSELEAEFRAELEANPVTAAMVERDFCLQASCLEAYARTAGRVGGAAAGAAACTAVGAAGVATLCGSLGAILGGRLAELAAAAVGQLRPARAQTLEEQMLDAYLSRLEDEALQTRLREGLLAAVAYAAERRAAVDELVRGRTLSRENASAMLSRAGVPTLAQASRFFRWRQPGEYPQLPTTEPEKSERYWAVWQIAESLANAPVTSARVRAAYDLTHPVYGGVSSLDTVREFQATLRAELPELAERAARSTHIDVTGGARVPVFGGIIRRAKNGGALLLLALVGGAIALRRGAS